jgi:hypothetical protein
MARASRSDPDRLLVRDPWRHYRRTYSMKELRWGLAVLAALVAIAVWIAWKGDQVDPSLFGGSALPASATPNAIDRGPVPTGLASPGWSEDAISQFDADNLYVKINGRADYFLAFGFQRLYFAPLRYGADEEVTVDVELYDLGTAANALGAFSGESKEGDAFTASDTGMSHLARNALFMARGQYYVRAIGADESETVQAQLRHLRDVFERTLEGEALPWAYGLFAGKLGIGPDRVEYSKQNAFSFGFASEVYVARLDDDTELFVVQRDSAEAAGELAQQFVDGFLKLGSEAEGLDDAPWVEDRFLGTLATAVAVDRWVVGVRGAPNHERGFGELGRLREAIGER